VLGGVCEVQARVGMTYSCCVCDIVVHNASQVYRASWNGTTVAVKVIETTEVLGDGSVAGEPSLRLC
jgi:hypothetical protein